MEKSLISKSTQAKGALQTLPALQEQPESFSYLEARCPRATCQETTRPSDPPRAARIPRRRMEKMVLVSEGKTTAAKTSSKHTWVLQQRAGVGKANARAGCTKTPEVQRRAGWSHRRHRSTDFAQPFQNKVTYEPSHRPLAEIETPETSKTLV